MKNDVADVTILAKDVVKVELSGVSRNVGNKDRTSINVVGVKIGTVCGVRRATELTLRQRWDIGQ